MPGSELPEAGRVISFDKVAHIGIFAVLSFTMIVGLKKQYTYKSLNLNAEWYAVTICIVIGFFIEIAQYFSHERSFEWFDLLADGIGAMLGYIFFLIIYRF